MDEIIIKILPVLQITAFSRYFPILFTKGISQTFFLRFNNQLLQNGMAHIDGSVQVINAI